MELTGTTALELVVSRGPRGEVIEADGLVGKRFEEALDQLSVRNVPFTFTVRAATGKEGKGMVVSQSPEPGTEMLYGAVLQLVMTRPAALPAKEVFGLFEYVLPDYPILVDLRLEAVTPTERKVLFAMKHPGGPLAIPYRPPRRPSWCCTSSTGRRSAGRPRWAAAAESRRGFPRRGREKIDSLAGFAILSSSEPRATRSVPHAPIRASVV